MPRIWKFGDDVNTDVIIPARYNITTDPTELAKFCFCEDRPDFAREAKAGDIIVAGSNFGCGSSREHAPIAIKACGISAIIAPSYARIFHRNAMNIGLAAVESTELLDGIEDGMEATFSLESGILQVGSRSVSTTPLPHAMIQLIQAGGLTNFVRNQNIEELLAS